MSFGGGVRRLWGEGTVCMYMGWRWHLLSIRNLRKYRRLQAADRLQCKAFFRLHCIERRWRILGYSSRPQSNLISLTSLLSPSASGEGSQVHVLLGEEDNQWTAGHIRLSNFGRSPSSLQYAGCLLQRAKLELGWEVRAQQWGDIAGIHALSWHMENWEG